MKKSRKLLMAIMLGIVHPNEVKVHDGTDPKENCERRWANIVVTNGKVENGAITGATMTTYLVWIPRYQYSLDKKNQRTNVKFIDGVDDSKLEAGYRVPEAFFFITNKEVVKR